MIMLNNGLFATLLCESITCTVNVYIPIVVGSPAMRVPVIDNPGGSEPEATAQV
jgi:hypothetical protein